MESAVQDVELRPVARQGEKPVHMPVLDGVRAVAILSVMVFHFFQGGPTLTSALSKVFGKLALLGQTGVDVFFVLSGFLITGILLNLRGRSNALSTFFWRRAIRIFPLYYAYLIGVFLLLPVLHLVLKTPLMNQWGFWVYAQDLQATFVPGFEFFGPGHFWSLAVEEHFYLVWPFLVLSLSEKRLVQISVGVVGAAMLSRAVLVAFGYSVFYFTPCRMDALAIGSLLALMARDKDALRSAGTWLRRWGVWVALAIVPAYLLFSGTGNPVVQIFKFTLLALLCASALVLALTTHPEGKVAQVLGSRPCGVIAKGSYALYVFHPGMFNVCRPLYDRLPVGVCLVIAFGAAGAASFLSWHLLEAPFLRLRDALTPAKKLAA